MISQLFVLASGLFAGMSSSNAPLDVSNCDFGLVYAMRRGTCTITVTNTGNRNLTISALRSAKYGVQAHGLPLRLSANGTGQIEVSVNTGQRIGKIHEYATLYLNPQSPDQEALRKSVILSGFVYSELNSVQPKLQFGTVDLNRPKREQISLRSDDSPEIRATSVLAAPEFIQVKAAKGGQEITARVQPSSDWGLQSGVVLVAINSKFEPRVQIPVTANVHGRVIPADNPYALGVLRTNQENQITVQLTSQDDKPFRIAEVSLNKLSADWRVLPCSPARIGCKLLELTLKPNQPVGFIAGAALATILPDDIRLTIGFQGLLLPPEAKIQSLDKAQEDPEEGAKSKVADAPVDFSKALKKTMAPPSLPPPDPPGTGPVLRWSVANEQTLYGYLIYRAEHEDGPWQRVNERIIPVLGHDDAPSDYAWRDTSAVKGKTYWYFIKTLANNGSKQKLTEAHKVVAH